MRAYLLISLIPVTLIFLGLNDTRSSQKLLINDDYNYIAINDVKMYISNNGQGSSSPGYGMGFFWPGGEEAEKTVIYRDGLVWGGKVNSEIRVNGSTAFTGLQAGKILPDGSADNPDDPRYRVYKIRHDWESLPPGEERDAYEVDYHEWPVADGAPWIDIDGDGIYTVGVDEPEFLGDEMLWCVSNDMDTARSHFTYGSDPISFELQTLVYGFDEDNFLADAVFKKYKLIHKGTTAIDSMYLSYWIDTDLGNVLDDYVGCDTLLNLGYTYNADNEDGDGSGYSFGTPPPAVGHMIVQGPIIQSQLTDSAKFGGKWISGCRNLPLSSFFIYIGSDATYKDPIMRDYQGAIELYNNMKALTWRGDPVVDPHTGLISNYVVPGDPVTSKGWYEGSGWPGGEAPRSCRYLMTSGPFAMAVGDTQEVEIAIFMGMGADNLDSITKLRATAREIHMLFGNEIPNSVEETRGNLLHSYHLYQNYPNPFNPLTTIDFSIPVSDYAKINIYNITGQLVTTLLERKVKSGNHTIEFNAQDLASGIYLYQLQSGSFQDVKKMVLIK